MSKTIEIAIPDEVFLGLRKSPQKVSAELRIAAAVKWYETDMVSQGKAAEIAGLSRSDFIAALSRFSVASNVEAFDDTPCILAIGESESCFAVVCELR